MRALGAEVTRKLLPANSRARSRVAEDSPLAFRQTAERQPADAFAVQRDDVVADRGEHPPRLVVAAFVPGSGARCARRWVQAGRQSCAFSRVEHQPCRSRTAPLRRRGPARAWRDRPSHTGFRRDDPVQQLAVVSEQQQAGVPGQAADPWTAPDCAGGIAAAAGHTRRARHPCSNR